MCIYIYIYQLLSLFVAAHIDYVYDAGVYIHTHAYISIVMFFVVTECKGDQNRSGAGRFDSSQSKFLW